MQNFSIFKNNKKEKENQPDYNISCKIGEKYENIGGCWLKESNGNKFFSCKLNGVYNDRRGYTIEVELPQKNNALREPHEGAEDFNPGDSPF